MTSTHSFLSNLDKQRSTKINKKLFAIFSAIIFVFLTSAALLIFYIVAENIYVSDITNKVSISRQFYVFLNEKQLIGMNLAAVWLLPIIVTISACFVFEFIKANEIGFSFWLKKYLLTASNDKFRINIFHLTGRIIFSIFALEWIRESNSSMKIKELWKKVFHDRNPFFANELVSGADRLSKFRHWLNDYHNRKWSPFQYVAVINASLFCIVSICGISTILTLAILFPLKMSTIGVMTEVTYISILVAAVFFNSLGLFMLRAFCAVEQRALWGWFSDETRSPMELHKDARLIALAAQPMGSGRNTNVLIMTLLWTWAKYLKQQKVEKNFPAFSRASVRALAETFANIPEIRNLADY